MEDKVGDKWTVLSNREYDGTVTVVTHDMVFIRWLINGQLSNTDSRYFKTDMGHLLKLSPAEPSKPIKNHTTAWSLR